MAFGLVILHLVVGCGVAGYMLLGFSLLDAVYQTTITVTTVGFREVRPLSSAGKVFTIVLILLGVGTVLYTFTTLVEAVVEGQLLSRGRRRMERQVAGLSGHVIVCGWGRVGRVIARYVAGGGQEVVVVDRDPDRLAEVPHPTVQGDCTDDTVLVQAGIERCRVLVAALDTDADNLYVTLSGRTLRPDLFVIARARVEASEEKLRRAGANRVVNPQHIGGARMAAFALQPHVAEFLDVVMHDGSLQFRLEEVKVAPSSPLAGHSLRDSHIRDHTGALVLALRDGDGGFATNPDPSTVVQPGQVLIAIGTDEQLRRLVDAARAPS